MLAVLAPGQGSQKPGFLTPWLSDHSSLNDHNTGASIESRLRWWSTLAGTDLIHLGTKADADEIKDTAKTQPLLVAAALLAAEQLPLRDVAVVAGHSVGEIGAAAIAEVLSPEAAVTLAGLRGREMAAACAIEPTGMSAVLGGTPEEVLAAIADAGLYPANRNGAGQVVAAGSLSGLDKLSANPPARAKIIKLSVAGAFHTPYMATAETALAAVAPGITVHAPHRLLLSNLDGTAVTSGPQLLQRLVKQVTAPVRWDECMRTLADLGVTAVIELPPAGTLAGLIKRAIKGVEIVTVNTPDDLEAARDLINRHSMHSTHEPFPHFHVAVASAAGNFQPADNVTVGDEIKSGQLIGCVQTRQGNVDIKAHSAGTLVEWLAQPADPIAPGHPVARLQPAVGAS